ncbi:MAG: DUF2796 domain-containing protein [Thiobacillaceae bacterium]|nr:DUF2796 domain-containing protein [Thiobacillaceae bacterium]MCX7674172.1 DUF2796 domain-containing protein [Thiobacillaceae bacterium]MDW8322890.1 DUF2796 domain-containing protein [Burkholderiales bacterium]
MIRKVIQRATTAAWSALVLALTPGHWAQAHGVHQHGVARLEVAVEGAQLVIRLDSPLDNLLGFERAPRTAAERTAAAALIKRLESAQGLFLTSPVAGCTLASAEVEAPVLQGGSAREHADLVAEWRYTCRAPERLTGLRVLLFKDYPRLRRLDAAVVGPRGQRAAQLTARLPDLAW